MRVRTRVLLLPIIVCLALLLTACNRNNDPGSEPAEPDTTPTVSEGDTFLATGFKARTEIKIKNSVSSDSLIFEVYVDGSGNGNGLVGYRDNVYDVHLVSDQIYVVVSPDVVVHITDVSAHMVPTDLSLIGNNNLKSLGFSLLDGRVVSYTGGNASVDMVSKFESSVSTFEPVAISQSNNMTTGDLLKYFFEQTSTVYVEPGTPTEEELERQSYYVNSAYGIVIRDNTYSIGDFCAPYTYFEGATPQGMNEVEERREDEKVTFVYVSYISRDGSSTFVTTDGYVQSITTSSEFVFLDKFKKGMSDERVAKLLGVGLKKDEIASFTPVVEGLYGDKGGKGYVATLGDLSIEFTIGKKSKTLTAITITNYLDFRR